MTEIKNQPILGIRVEVTYTEALVKLVDWTRESDLEEEKKKKIIEHAEAILQTLPMVPIVGKIAGTIRHPEFNQGDGK